MNSAVFDLFHTNEELSEQLYGQQRRVYLDFNWVYTFDPDYAMVLLNNPKREIGYLAEYAKGATEVEKEIHVINLPTTERIHRVNASHVNKLLMVKGVIVQRSSVLMRVVNLCYKCRACGDEVMVPQNSQHRETPVKCIECEGRRFKPLYEQSEYTTYQEIVLQELLGDTPSGGSPDKIKVELQGSLIRSCEPGEEVTVVGILEVRDIARKRDEVNLEPVIHAVSLVNDTDTETITLNSEDVEHIKQIMTQPDHLNKIVESIAPTIYGMNHIKQALAYQLCEGQAKQIGKTRKRGQFHILLAGPPGYGKSELGDFMVKCHPKGRKAIGRGASGVGLTASVVKDGEGFVLRAGAMALADNGFLFIDEIEKMSTNDSGAMHPAMEQQEIFINKADISATLKTRCSVLAACNPLDGDWNEYKTIVGNLHDKGRGLPRPLLDRFALIFIIRKNKNVDREEKVIEHIFKVNTVDNAIDPPYSLEELRKIFAYARSLEVHLSEETSKRLTEFYKILYETSLKDDALLITRRQPEDLVRIAESSARLHGRTETNRDDAEAAIKIVAISLKDYGIDPDTGEVDQMKALYTQTKTRKQMVNECAREVARLCKHNIDKTKVSRVEFVNHASKLWGVSSGEVGEVLNVVLRDGTLFCPTPYTLAVAESLNTSLDTYGDE